MQYTLTFKNKRKNTSVGNAKTCGLSRYCKLLFTYLETLN